MKGSLAVRLLVAGVLVLFSAHAPADLSGLPDTLERIKPSIVGVGTYQATRAPQARLLGTGFAVLDGRLILTNDHVVPQRSDMDENERIVVVVDGGRNPDVRGVTIVHRDETIDLAVLRLEGRPLPAMEFESPGRVREGQEFAFTGYPIGAVLGLNPVTHRALLAGILPVNNPALSARQLDPATVRRLRGQSFEVYQLDATAYPGNSGSPLYSADTGKVIGIINRVYVQGGREHAIASPSGISYAIPVEQVRRSLSEAGLLE